MKMADAWHCELLWLRLPKMTMLLLIFPSCLLAISTHHPTPFLSYSSFLFHTSPLLFLRPILLFLLLHGFAHPLQLVSSTGRTLRRHQIDNVGERLQRLFFVTMTLLLRTHRTSRNDEFSVETKHRQMTSFADLTEFFRTMIYVYCIYMPVCLSICLSAWLIVRQFISNCIV